MKLKKFAWKLYHTVPKPIQKGIYNTYMLKKDLPKPVLIKTKSEPVFCFSLDLDLGVGAVHTRHPWKKKEIIGGDRKAFFPLLDCIKKHSIKATWAVCGHSFLDKCKRANGVAHPNLKRIKTEWYKGDWFREDPCTNFKVNNEWYAPDLIKILKKEKQELACHSFSHILFSHKSCTKEIAEQEITECLKVAAPYKIKFNTFIYPYNKIGHVDLLKKFGFKCFRSAKCFIGDALLNQGIYEIPSLAPITNHPKIKKYLFNNLENGIKNGGIIHFWSHPWAFRNRKLLKLLDEFLNEVRNKADSGQIKIKTMQKLI